MPAPPTYRLRKHADYQRVYKAGRKQWAREIAYFSTLRRPNSPEAQRSETTGPRVGLTVPRALGKAVDRNRIKRRLRVLVREALGLLGGLPVDVILHPKRAVLEADFPSLQREMRHIFKSVHSRHRSAQVAAILPAETGHPQAASRR